MHLGGGGSVRQLPTPIPMTKRMAAHFLEAPSHFSIKHAVRYGQILALGGDRQLVEAICATRLGSCFKREDFWSTVIRFFIDHPLLDRTHVGPIIDYLHNQRFQSEYNFVAPGVRERIGPPQPNLSVRGRTPETLLRQVERWHRQLGRHNTRSAVTAWMSSGIRPFEFETGRNGSSLRIWTIRELLTSGELQTEGRIMQHCVASYAHSCQSGRSSIWTMELHGYEGVEKRQTIEVNAQKVIVQSRGKRNALPGQVECEIVERWAVASGLRVAALGVRR